MVFVSAALDKGLVHRANALRGNRNVLVAIYSRIIDFEMEGVVGDQNSTSFIHSHEVGMLT